MAEEIPLDGLNTEELLVRTITTLNALVKDVRLITKAVGNAERLHWKCIFYPGRDGEGPKIAKQVEAMQTEIGNTKAYLAGMKKGLWLAVIALAALYGGDQVGLSLKAVLALLKGGP